MIALFCLDRRSSRARGATLHRVRDKSRPFRRGVPPNWRRSENAAHVRRTRAASQTRGDAVSSHYIWETQDVGSFSACGCQPDKHDLLELRLLLSGSSLVRSKAPNGIRTAGVVAVARCPANFRGLSLDEAPLTRCPYLSFGESDSRCSRIYGVPIDDERNRSAAVSAPSARLRPRRRSRRAPREPQAPRRRRRARSAWRMSESLRVCPKTSGGITKFSEHEAD